MVVSQWATPEEISILPFLWLSHWLQLTYKEKVNNVPSQCISQAIALETNFGPQKLKIKDKVEGRGCDTGALYKPKAESIQAWESGGNRNEKWVKNLCFAFHLWHFLLLLDTSFLCFSPRWQKWPLTAPKSNIICWSNRKLCFLPLSQVQPQILKINNLKGPRGIRCPPLDNSYGSWGQIEQNDHTNHQLGLENRCQRRESYCEMGGCPKGCLVSLGSTGKQNQ